MKARKLPSGKWNVRVMVWKTDEGKPVYRSFTAAKKEDVIKQAYSARYDSTDMTVEQMVSNYMVTKEAVISPNTYRGYRGIYRARIKESLFGGYRVSWLNNSLVQKWVSEIAKEASPKTVKNSYSLFNSALKMYYPSLTFSVKLPQTMKPKLHTPSTTEIKKLLECAKTYNYELYKAVLLGAVGMMRQGEIAALTAEDVNWQRHTIHICKSQAYTKDKKYVIKPPKNESSNRTIILPDFVIETFPKEGNIVNLNVLQISSYFRKLMRKTDLPHFRFHDLRHYAASIAASSSVGASVESIKARGGWASDSMMKRVYIDQIGEEVDKDTLAINTYLTQEFDKK